MSIRCLLVYAIEFGVVYHKAIAAGLRDEVQEEERAPAMATCVDKELDLAPRGASGGGVLVEQA